jgi:hypothetical protein
MGEMTGGDLLREAVAELYSADPDMFVARRGELAKQARAAGEAATAKQIAALRRPTRSAWVVNQLARAEPGAAEQLAALGEELRSAQAALDGKAIRDLSRQRRQLIDALARRSFSAAGLRSPPAVLREEVASTLGAAMADPAVAEQLRAGALERVVYRDGLGAAAAPQLPAGQSSGESRSAVESRSTVVPLSSGRLSSARRRAPAAAGAGGRARPTAKVTALATARARAERERRREAVAEAELALGDADRTLRSAARTERDLQNAVRMLEEQLADARQRLAEARLQAHRARTGERRARRALDRLQD